MPSCRLCAITDTLARVPFIAAPGFDDYVATNSEARAVAADIITHYKA